MARVHACLECGEPKPSRGEFCTTKCRQTFNNRRKLRGAELYDLYMVLRFERGLAKLLGIFQLINRMASNFRQEDKDKRAGRRSWRRPQAVIEERPYLRAIVTHVRIGRAGAAR